MLMVEQLCFPSPSPLLVAYRNMLPAVLINMEFVECAHAKGKGSWVGASLAPLGHFTEPVSLLIQALSPLSVVATLPMLGLGCAALPAHNGSGKGMEEAKIPASQELT